MNNSLQITSVFSRLSLPELMQQRLVDCRAAEVTDEVCTSTVLHHLHHGTKEVHINGILELSFINNDTQTGNMIQPFAGYFLFTCVKDATGLFEAVWCTSLS